MFEILNKGNATPDELMAGYGVIQSAKVELEAKRNLLKAEFTRLQQKAMSGDDVAIELKTARDAITENENRLEACSSGLAEVLKKLEKAIPDHRARQIAEKREEIAWLRGEKEQGLAEVLDLYARAFVRDATVRRGHRMDYPKIILSEPDLGGQNWAEFRRLVLKYADEMDVSSFTDIETKMDRLSADIRRLENENRNFNPNVEIPRLLNIKAA